MWYTIIVYTYIRVHFIYIVAFILIVHCSFLVYSVRCIEMREIQTVKDHV